MKKKTMLIAAAAFLLGACQSQSKPVEVKPNTEEGCQSPKEDKCCSKAEAPQAPTVQADKRGETVEAPQAKPEAIEQQSQATVAAPEVKLEVK